MKILFAPDYHEGQPYQGCLSTALTSRGVDVEYLSHYRRVFPLFRGVGDLNPDALHIHWPEAYFPQRHDRFDWFRVRRYSYDLNLAVRDIPLFLTAHNLLPHNRHKEAGVFQNIQATVSRADGIFVHSRDALEKIVKTFGVGAEKCHIIPFGDHSVALGEPLKRAEARKHLGLGTEERISLIFGSVSPYKGSDDVIKWWSENQGVGKLFVVGPVFYEEYANELRNLADGANHIELRLSDGFLSEEELKTWLSAVDCCIFNYRDIFSSGAASLARSFGIPLLIPERLKTAYLGEPHSHVFRFDQLDTDFRSQLEQALQTPVDYRIAEEWRNETSWDRVAEQTHKVYSEVLSDFASSQTPESTRGSE